MSVALEQSVRVTPPSDALVRVIATSTTSQVVSLAEYAPASNPSGQMRLTLQADGADLYVCFTNNASAVVAAATTAAPGTSAAGSNAVPGIKIPNGTSLTIHHSAGLSNFVAVVGTAAGYLRYWRTSRVGAA